MVKSLQYSFNKFDLIVNNFSTYLLYENNRCISWTFLIQTRCRRQLSEGSRWRRAIRNLTIYLRPAGNNLFVNHFLKIYCWANFVINLKRGCWDHRLYWMQKSADFSPELVGEIDSSEVKDINGHNWKIGKLYITAGNQKKMRINMSLTTKLYPL